MFFLILFCALILWSSNEATKIKIDNNYNINNNEQFFKNISHYYCDRLIGTYVVLLAENSAESFYNALQK